jgi:hypothetical protein
MDKILSSALHYQKIYIGKMINSSYMYVQDDAKIKGSYVHSGIIATFSRLYLSFYHLNIPRPVYATYIVSCLYRVRRSEFQCAA